MNDLEFDLSAKVESLDQLKAILAFNLRHAMTTNVPEWVAEGLALSHLLTSEPNVEAHAARDRCWVRREWLKLALNDLANILKDRPSGELVTFAFDGSMLSIECGRRIIVQAEGSAWREAYQVRADHLAGLPKRLMRDPINVEVSDDDLIVGNRGVPLAKSGRDDGGL